MGIQGLLPVLRSISRSVHVSSYAGKRVAVDAYGWLHKAAYGCSMELCEGLYTDRFEKKGRDRSLADIALAGPQGACFRAAL